MNSILRLVDQSKLASSGVLVILVWIILVIFFNFIRMLLLELSSLPARIPSFVSRILHHTSVSLVVEFARQLELAFAVR